MLINLSIYPYIFLSISLFIVYYEYYSITCFDDIMYIDIILLRKCRCVMLQSNLIASDIDDLTDVPLS